MHLARYMHDVTNEITEIWCDAERWISDDATKDIDRSDCLDGLEAAMAYGREAGERRLAIESAAATSASRCEHPPGAHPAHRNYLEGAAERDGSICRLGWPR